MIKHVNDEGEIIAVTSLDPMGISNIAIPDRQGYLVEVEIPFNVMLSFAQDFLFANGFEVKPREYK
jgi:hypothetical protein